MAKTADVRAEKMAREQQATMAAQVVSKHINDKLDSLEKTAIMEFNSGLMTPEKALNFVAQKAALRGVLADLGRDIERGHEAAAKEYN